MGEFGLPGQRQSARRSDAGRARRTRRWPRARREPRRSARHSCVLSVVVAWRHPGPPRAWPGRRRSTARTATRSAGADMQAAVAFVCAVFSAAESSSRAAVAAAARWRGRRRRTDARCGGEATGRRRGGRIGGIGVRMGRPGLTVVAANPISAASATACCRCSSRSWPSRPASPELAIAAVVRVDQRRRLGVERTERVRPIVAAVGRACGGATLQPATASRRAGTETGQRRPAGAAAPVAVWTCFWYTAQVNTIGLVARTPPRRSTHRRGGRATEAPYADRAAGYARIRPPIAPRPMATGVAVT